MYVHIGPAKRISSDVDDPREPRVGGEVEGGLRARWPRPTSNQIYGSATLGPKRPAVPEGTLVKQEDDLWAELGQRLHPI